MTAAHLFDLARGTTWWFAGCALGEIINRLTLRRRTRRLRAECADLEQTREQLCESTMRLIAQRERVMNRIRGVRPS